MDLKALTDDELNAHCIEVRTEQERRQRLAAIPAQIAELATRYEADGGDVSTLSLTPTPVEEV